MEPPKKIYKAEICVDANISRQSYCCEFTLHHFALMCLRPKRSFLDYSNRKGDWPKYTHFYLAFGSSSILTISLNVVKLAACVLEVFSFHVVSFGYLFSRASRSSKELN